MSRVGESLTLWTNLFIIGAKFVDVAASSVISSFHHDDGAPLSSRSSSAVSVGIQ